jgi:hypothetical protein
MTFLTFHLTSAETVFSKKCVNHFRQMTDAAKEEKETETNNNTNIRREDIQTKESRLQFNSSSMNR